MTDRVNGKPTEIPKEPTASLSYDGIEKIEPVGSGGNADVYKAVADTPRGKITFALKEPRMSGTLHTETAERLMEEAETWDRLDDHDHIVGVIDYDSEPLPWIAMEYMDAGHIGEQAGDMDFDQALWTAISTTEAVRHAHRRGVAHLDLKPENVLFRSVEDAWDVPKVADWGLSKHLLNHSKSVEGLSPQYSAPEQFDDSYGAADDITDVYQLGAVFYELFTGEPPFEGQPAMVMNKVMNEKPTPPSEVGDVPEGIDDILLTAMAKEKADRYESVLYLRDELQDLSSEIGRSRDETTQQKNRTSTGIETEKASATSTDDYSSPREEPQEINTVSEKEGFSSEAESEVTETSDQVGDGSGGSSLLTRRRTLGFLGASAVGGAGWFVSTQMGGNGEPTSEDDGNGAELNPVPETAVGQDGNFTDMTGQDEVEISVGAGPEGRGYKFNPADIRINPGTTVRWVWTGRGSQHNVVEADGTETLSDPSFESELTAEEGHEFTHTFEEAGTYDYVCSVHLAQDMVGSVEVVEGSDSNQTFESDDVADNVEITVGPQGAWRFEPEEVEVTVGGTVEWYFASGGHNVTSHPDAHNECENPEGAEPFTSYEGDNHMSVEDVDSIFSHTFETPGEYTYVCVPHATRMVGYITVVDV